MVAFNIEQAVCTGRGFDAAGFLGKFRTWITKAPLAGPGGGGGPGWYEHDVSQVAAGTDPYIVVSDKNAAGPNVVAKYIQAKLPSATSGRVDLYFYLYWNPTLHKGYGLYNARAIPTLDAADFIYDFRGGPECLLIQSLTSTNWDGAFIDEWTADPNLLDSVSATTAVANFTHNGTLQIRGADVSGTLANLIDSGRRYYVSVIFVSGTTWRIDVWNDTARDAGHLVCRSANFTGLTAGVTGSVTASAINGSGVQIQFQLVGATVADATIVWQYDRINVGTGEGAQFVVGNYYFIYDFTLQNAVNSFKVISVAGDQLEIDRLCRPFPLGAKIGSYPHKFIAGGTNTSYMNEQCNIPYYNVAGTASSFVNGSDNEQNPFDYLTLGSSYISNGPCGAVGASTDDGYLTRLSPDRKGRYAVQRPGIYERKAWGHSPFSGDNGNTGYGTAKNIINGPVVGMSVNIHGRRLNSIDYTYFRAMNQYIAGVNNGSWGFMFRETQSNS